MKCKSRFPCSESVVQCQTMAHELPLRCLVQYIIPFEKFEYKITMPIVCQSWGMMQSDVEDGMVRTNCLQLAIFGPGLKKAPSVSFPIDRYWI